MNLGQIAYFAFLVAVLFLGVKYLAQNGYFTPHPQSCYGAAACFKEGM